MAHTRKDTRTAPPEWWRHLRPYNKKKVAKAERRAAKGEILEEMESEAPPVGLGLRNDPREMEWMRRKKGGSVVPRGSYCYDEDGPCPYWDQAENGEEKGDGYCWLVGRGDWDDGIVALFDQCKICGHKEEWAPDGTLVPEDETDDGLGD